MTIAAARHDRIAHWLLSVSLLLPLACSRTEGPPPSPPVPVRVATVARRSVPIELDAIGTVTPVTDVEIKAQVEGPIAEIHVADGQQVAPGDLLFTIDPAPFEAALEQARAGLARSRAQAESSRTSSARQEKLFAEGVASKQVVDDARTRTSVDQGSVRAEEAAVHRAELDLEHTRIGAPIAGQLGVLLVHRGAMVKPDDTALVTIKQIAPIDVLFTVPEPRLPEVQAAFASGAVPVLARPGGSQGDPERGVLGFLDNEVDRSTGTIALKARFDNASRRLWPGQYVDVVMQVGERADAVVVPGQAVQAGQNGDLVFIVDEQDHAQVRPVKVDFARGGSAVVASGLNPGERVVVDGQLRLAPGAAVKIESEPANVAGQPAAQP
jgi:multidrug efflux system membrane fusion protein